MDSKKFFGKIREIIREEIDYALDRKLNSNVNKKISEERNRELDLINQSKKIKSVTPNKTSSNYTSIQDLLEETRRSITENYDDLNELRFTSSDVDSYNTIVPNGIDSSDIPSEVANALNRNYSELLKKIDEKSRR
jgi:hypothetical protein